MVKITCFRDVAAGGPGVAVFTEPLLAPGSPPRKTGLSDRPMDMSGRPTGSGRWLDHRALPGGLFRDRSGTRFTSVAPRKDLSRAYVLRGSHVQVEHQNYVVGL